MTFGGGSGKGEFDLLIALSNASAKLLPSQSP
jgi:hypothetical protein